MRFVNHYKKGNKTQPGNYRPVSILNVVSKIVERVVYKQVETYLNEKAYFMNSIRFPSWVLYSFNPDLYLTDHIRLCTLNITTRMLPSHPCCLITYASGTYTYPFYAEF